MADFDPPFGSDAERRLATALEKELGFGCGPANQPLFNGLFWQLQSELAAIHAEAGITPDDSTTTTTLDAILALISAATGGNPDGYILMTQARARLPIFPDVQNTDGRIVVTSPSPGTVRIPGGVEFLHRGIFTITTAQTDFATTASKIYHLRWDPTNGYRLIETGNATYNPGSLAETDPAFDSTYDDMLIARVVTNSSNVATITNLANKDRLFSAAMLSSIASGNVGQNVAWFDFSHTLAWARTPKVSELYPAKAVGSVDPNDADYNISSTSTAPLDLFNAAPVINVNRYGLTSRSMNDDRDLVVMRFSAVA
ncbi:hypothetical protein [Aurantimonas coralicida]|uniref:hypothetical protein n=1 Tax=Aurantimonas coralicida TaxID=182270 RepID=UPI00239BE246|nr:hypothetical protein [Aurantimonas coralicida]MDE0922369.1 hypothetical protein [Aurantimonas coralicida]